MLAWWTSLTLFMKILWTITLVSSLIFIIQSILTFIGADAGDGGIDTDFGGADAGGFDSGVGGDFDADTSGDIPDMGSGLNLLTFRNFVNFFLGFGWTAVLFAGEIKSTGLLMLLSIAVGVALVFAVMYLFKWLSSMQQTGTINVYTTAVGCTGKVYLTIPAARSGEGKVQITINNSVREYDALTDGDELPTGTNIKVLEAVDAHTLLVEGLDSLII
ncbi:MAG: NfeD family protein [Bacteroidales bacterium]|nr:NfeD family protein [Bacteroidales bacterium]